LRENVECPLLRSTHIWPSFPNRSTLEELHREILTVIPDSEQCISYGLPAFRVNGKVVAGFAAFKHPPELLATQRFGISRARH
jgi:uncharacterized protein YdhG (YjbR/CyaY superfamily)